VQQHQQHHQEAGDHKHDLQGQLHGRQPTR
jgi:hypothetical protein